MCDENYPPQGANTEWLDLMDVGELAEVLRTTKKAIYSMTERRLLPPPLRIGRRILFRRVDVIRFLQEKRAASPGEDKR